MNDDTTTWECPRCKAEIDDEYMCSKCGLSKARYIYNQMLTEELEGDTPYGNSITDALVRFAYKYVASRNMPVHLAEEAVSNAYVRLVENIRKFDVKKGEFLPWAIQVVKNELRTLAKRDERYHRMIAFSIDEESEADDGNTLKIESVIGSSLSAEDLIAMEERAQFRIMAKLARRALGEYTRFTMSGKLLEGEVYDVCVDAYTAKGSVGWKTVVINTTGISYGMLDTRVERARRTWRDWTRVQERKARMQT